MGNDHNNDKLRVQKYTYLYKYLFSIKYLIYLLINAKTSFRSYNNNEMKGLLSSVLIYYTSLVSDLYLLCD